MRICPESYEIAGLGPAPLRRVETNTCLVILVMDESFDPYRKWLGIPPQDHPPHYYRLLGIEPLESDPDVIATAVDGRMGLLKNFAVGQHSDESQRMLNEIAAAKVCLLNSEKKAEYDLNLRRRLEAEKRSVAKAAAPAVRRPRPAPGPVERSEIPNIESSAVMSYVAGRGRKPRSWRIPVTIGAVAALAVGLSIFLLSRTGDATMAEQPETLQQQPKTKAPHETLQSGATPPVSPGPETLGPETVTPVPTAPEPVDPDPSEVASEQPQPPDDPPADPDEPSRADNPGRLLADLLDPADPLGVAPGDPQGDGATRLPAPDQQARREAEKKIRDVFKQEFSEVGDPQKKSNLAAKLFMQGQQTTDDPTSRFVLMELACQMSAEAGELALSLEVAGQMQRLYQVDALAIKGFLLDKAVKTTWSGRPASVDRQIVQAALRLIEESVANDDLVLATRFLKTAVTGARRCRDSALLRKVTERGQELDRQARQFDAAKQALDLLAEEPANARANLTAGRWYCFYAGNWEKGLPMLAKGNDPVLSEMARREMTRPQDAKDQLALADDWLALAEKQSGPVKSATEARAVYWFKQSLPSLAGLASTRVEKTIERLAPAEQPSTQRVQGVVQPGNVALASNGTQVSGVEKGGANLIDGSSTDFSGWKGVAVQRWPCEWVITFDKVYQLREIRLRLYDLDRRGFRYQIESSADGKNFRLLEDRSRGFWSSWQQITFRPRPVKALKFVGLRSSTNEWIHVVELEAYCIAPKLPRR